MRKIFVLFMLALSWFFLAAPHTLAAQEKAAAAAGGITGKCIIKADFYGTPLYFQMELKDEAGKLTGELNGDKLEGSLSGNSIHFVAKDEHGGTEECTAALKDGLISGTVTEKEPGDPEHPR